MEKQIFRKKAMERMLKYTLLLSLAMAISFIPTTSYAAALTDNSVTGGSSGNCLPNGTFEIVTPDDVATEQPVLNTSGSNKILKTSQADETKKLPLLIIVIGFDNVPYDNDYDWASTIFSEEADDWSLAKYYLDNSHGKFTFAPVVEASEYGKKGNNNKADKVNDGIVHVAASMDHYDWTFPDDDPSRNIGKWRAAVSSAMKEADKFVDFSKYDRDGDGEIETNEMAIGFVVAGGEASYNDNRGKGIDDYLFWSQASTMSAVKLDGVKVSNYIAIAENTYFVPDEDGGNEYEKPFAPYDTLEVSETIDLTEGASQITTTVDTSTGDKLYRFIPGNDGQYFIGSMCTDGSADPIAHVFDSDGNLIGVYDDKSDSDNNFAFSIYYIDGETEYYDVQISDWNDGASYSVYFREDFNNWFGFFDDEEDLPVMEVGEEQDVSVSKIDDDYKEDTAFIFEPAESGWYSFYSSDYAEGSNPIGMVIDSDFDTIASNDNGNAEDDNDLNFRVDFYAEEGETYFLQAGDQYADTEYKAGLVKITEDAAQSSSLNAAYGNQSSDQKDKLKSSEEGSDNVQSSIAVLAHELGHYLGLPDYYDTVGESNQKWSGYDVGDLSIMCHGGWCSVSVDGENVFRPAAFDAYSRVMLGWDEAEEISADEIYTVKPDDFTSDSPYNVLKVKTDDADQYYLIENRQYYSWDEGLKESYFEKNETGGLVMWHVDEGIINQYGKDNEINTANHRPGLMPVYMEYDESDTAAFKLIGSKVDLKRPFFDEKKYNSDMLASEGALIYLPVYNGDDPAERVQNRKGKGLLISDTGENIKLLLTDTAHEHPLTEVEAKGATCAEAGNIAFWHCATCNKYFTDKDGTVEIDDNSRVIPATGEHSYGDWRITKKATCTEKGVKTCTCTVCGGTKTEDIDTTGHDWGEWEVTTPATITETGVETRVCKNDPKHTETRDIPKLAVYTITFKLDGGTLNGSTDDVVINYAEGEQITIPGAPAKEGYTFLYWEGSEYYPGDKYTVTENHTFTAKWKKNESSSPDNTGSNSGNNSSTDKSNSSSSNSNRSNSSDQSSAGDGNQAAVTKAKAAKTGDDTTVYTMFLLMMAASGMGLLSLKSRRSRRNVP